MAKVLKTATLQRIMAATEAMESLSGTGVTRSGNQVVIDATSSRSRRPYPTVRTVSGRLKFRIVSAAKDGANYRWVYTCKRVEKTGAAWSGWTDSADDTADYTLRNLIEKPNGATGVFGCGVNSANFPAGFALVPIGAGAIVEAWPEPDGAGGVEWWFQAPNQVDGPACTP